MRSYILTLIFLSYFTGIDLLFAKSSDTADKIIRLYAKNPSARDKARHELYYDDVVAELRNHPFTNFDLEGLDGYNKKGALALLLAYLPPQVIADEFGTDVLLWTWLNYNSVNSGSELLEKYSAITGSNPAWLEQARVASWNIYDKIDASLVLAIYSSIEKVNTKMGKISLPEILKKSLNTETKQISEERIKNYRLIPVNPLEKGGLGWAYPETTGRVFIDTPVAIGIVYKNELMAVLGVISEKPGQLMIRQVQRVKKSEASDEKIIKKKFSKGLMPFDWIKLLFHIGEAAAAAFDFESLVILSANNNNLTKINSKGEVHIALERALFIYDKTAGAFGFAQGYDGNWYKRINSEKLTEVEERLPNESTVQTKQSFCTRLRNHIKDLWNKRLWVTVN